MTMIIEIVVREKVHQLEQLLLCIHIMPVHMCICVFVCVCTCVCTCVCVLFVLPAVSNGSK
jgi:hypothetical protein